MKRITQVTAVAYLCLLGGQGSLAAAAAGGPFYGAYLHFFTGGSDGGEPKAGLVQSTDGNLYGTTSQGGNGYGTVFKISPSAPHTLTTMWTFSGGSDGGTPLAGLMEGIDGNLYGTTTVGGGSKNSGTLFRISTTAPYNLTTLWSFSGGSDGGVPVAGLLQPNDGDIYGTTSKGGNGYGTVFRINPTQSTFILQTIWPFTGGSDGGEPMAALLEPRGGPYGGPLYGTTYSGGNGYGTVFQINPASPGWNVTTMWSFTGGNDGGQPTAGLAQGSDGNFYGTTTEGGETALNPAGTVFRINPSAPYTVTTLASFDQSGLGGDGGGLVQGSDGNFYGLLDLAFNKYGGVFQLEPSAPINQNLSVIWAFTTAGWRPNGGLVQASDGNFYGTTSLSSDPSGSSGGVFVLLPPSPATQLQILLPGETATPGVPPGKTGTPNPQVAGVPFSVTVNAVDANFNVVATGWRQAGLASSDPEAILPGTGALVEGAGTFTVTLRTPGTQTLTAAATVSGWASAPVLSSVSDAVAVNASGLKLFVSNYGAGSIAEVAFAPNTSTWDVSVYASDGTPAPPGTGVPLNAPAGLAFDNFGNLVVANMKTNLMAQAAAGGGLGYWPLLNGSFGGYGSPYGRVGLAFDSQGNLFVANLADTGNPGFNPDSANTISEFQPVPPAPAVPTTYNGSIIASGLNGVRGLALDSHGNLFVANFEENTISELTYNSGASAWDVSALSVASGPPFDGPFGLAFDTAGNLYVANYNGNTISKVTFGAGGTATASTFAANGSGSPNSPLNQPAGLAFDGFGNLFVANFGDGTIAEVTTAGAVSTLVSSGLTQPSFLVPTTPPGSGVLANIIWTNTVGGNWSDPNNWSPNRVPGLLNSGASADDVAIAVPGTYTVILDVGGAYPNYWGLHTLALGAGLGGRGVQTLLVTNKTFVTASLTVLRGGQISSYNSSYTNNPLTVAGGGMVNSTNDTFHLAVAVASGGQLTGDNMTIAGDGWLTVNGALGMVGGSYLSLYGPGTNSGVMNLADGGLSIINEGTADPYYKGGLWNLPGGLINLAWGGGIQGQGCDCQFVNQGAVVSTNSEIGVPTFDNHAGTVTSASGALSIYQTFGPLAGTYYAASGASIYFNEFYRTCPGAAAPLVPGTPLVLAGGGQYLFQSGYLNLPTDAIPNLVLRGGTLTLGPGFQGGAIQNLALDGIELTNQLPVTGMLAATNSTIDGALVVTGGGQLTADNLTIAGDCWLMMEGTLDVVGGSFLDLYGPGTNSGVMNLADGGISIVNEGTPDPYYKGGLWNLPGGLINLAWGGGIQGQGCDCQFVNQGAVVSTNSEIGVPSFDNRAGTVTSASGALSIYQTFGPLAGTYYAASGASIYFNEFYRTCPGGAAPLVPGTPLVLAGGGQYRFQSGYLNLPTDVVPNLVLAGGTLTLGPGFQGGAIQNLALNGIELTNQLPVTGMLIATGSTIDGNLLVAGGGQVTADNMTIAGDGWLMIKGTLDVVGGSYLNLYGPATNSGVMNLASGGIQMINEAKNNPPNLSYQGNLWNLPGGLINLAWSGGIQGQGSGCQFVNQGAVVSTNSEISVPTFDNAGAVTAQSGMLTLGAVAPNTVVLEPSGSLIVGLNSLSDYGHVSFTGNAALAGAFGIQLNTNSFLPVVGDQFPVLAYPSYSGNFTAYSVPPSPCFSGLPGASGLTVTVVDCSSPGHWFMPRFLPPTRSGGALTLSWPSTSGWILEQSEALGSDAAWSPASGFTADNGTNYLTLTPQNIGPGAPPSLFFRLAPGP